MSQVNGLLVVQIQTLFVQQIIQINVEFVTVEQPDLVRILIWERGVGPTTASGTGACASAVAAAKYGGANRVLDVVSPGGAQHVEWDEDGIYLTGSAELIAHGKWFV